MAKMEGGLKPKNTTEGDADLRNKSAAEIQNDIAEYEKEMRDIDLRLAESAEEAEAKSQSNIPAEKKQSEIALKIKKTYEKKKAQVISQVTRSKEYLKNKKNESGNVNEKMMGLLIEYKNVQSGGDADKIAAKKAEILAFADKNDIKGPEITALRNEAGAGAQNKTETKTGQPVAKKQEEKKAPVVSPETESIQKEIIKNAEIAREKKIKEAEEELNKIKAIEEAKIAEAKKILEDTKKLFEQNQNNPDTSVVTQHRDAYAEAKDNLAEVQSGADTTIEAATKVFEKTKREAQKKFKEAVGVVESLVVSENVDKNFKASTAEIEGLHNLVKHLREEQAKSANEKYKQKIQKKIDELETRITALEKSEVEKATKKQSDVEKIKARIEGPKEEVPVAVETPMTDAERQKANAEARMKAFAEYNKNTDKDKAVENADNKIKNTPNSKNDFDKFLDVCKDRGLDNLAKQIGSTVPGFNDLPDGQKMLVLQGMNDALLGHVNNKANEKFQAEMAGKTSKLGKMWTSVRKNFLTSKFKKEELSTIQGNGAKSAVHRMDFINQNAPGLIEVFGKSGVDAYLGKDGRTVVTDFSNRKQFENASPYMKMTAEKYNQMANVLAHTPHENKKQYAKAEKDFQAAKNQFLGELYTHDQANGSKSPEFNASLYVKNSEVLMRTMSFLAADQKTSARLSEIANTPAFLQGFKDIIAERGMMTAGGAGARMGTKALMVSLGIMTVAGGPVSLAAAGAVVGSSAVISGVVGYFRGKKRAEKGLEDKDKLARRGQKQKGELAVGMGNINRHIDRLGKLQTELQNSNSPIERKQILSRMKTVHDFVEAKLDRREINFGTDKKQMFVNQNKLMNSMHEAQVAMQAELHEAELVNIFSKDASGAELGADTRMRRLLKMQGASNAERNEEARDKHVSSKARKSAFYGALAATAGGTVAHFAEEFGWIHPHGVHAGAHDTVPNNGGVNNVVGGVNGNGEFHPPLVLPNQKPFDMNDFLYGNKKSMPGNIDNGTGVVDPTHHNVGGGSHHEVTHHIKHPKHGTKLEDIPTRKNTDVPTWNEVDAYKFTDAQLAGINAHSHQMLSDALNKMNPEMTEYFKGHDASDFLKHNSLDVTNPDAKDLLENMQKMQALMGTKPKAGESIEQYFIRMTEFKDRAEILIQIKKGMNPFGEETPVASPVEEPEVPDMPEPEDLPDHVFSSDEILKYKFNSDETSVIIKLAERNRSFDMQDFFTKHPRWLNKKALHLFNRNEDHITNDSKFDLHQYMDNFAKETGIMPKKHQTVGEYLAMAEEYNAKKDLLNGNYPDDFIVPKSMSSHFANTVNTSSVHENVNNVNINVNINENVKGFNDHTEEFTKTTNNVHEDIAPTNTPKFETDIPKEMPPIRTYGSIEEKWYSNTLISFFGKEDSRAWNRIHDMTAEDYFQEGLVGMGKGGRMYRDWLEDQAKWYRIKIDHSMTVEDLSKMIALRRSLVESHKTLADIGDTYFNADKADITPVEPSEFHMPIEEPVFSKPKLIDANELQATAAENVKADAWVNSSVNEYFESPKVWNRISKLEAKYFVSNNEDYLKRNGVTSSQDALEFRRALGQYIKDNNIDMSGKVRVGEIMKEIGRQQKEGSLPFREMIEGDHKIKFNFAQENGAYNPVEAESAIAEIKATEYSFNSLNHTFSSAESTWMRAHSGEVMDYYNSKLADDGIINMNQMISKFGNDAYVSQVKDINLNDFLSAPKPAGDAGKFYDLLQDLKKTDTDSIKGEDTVNTFLQKVYMKDELLNYVRFASKTETAQ